MKQFFHDNTDYKWQTKQNYIIWVKSRMVYPS